MTAYGNILTAGYNGDGLRAWKQTATGRRYYLYDGEELVCELDAAGNAVAPVVFGANGLIAYGSFIYQFDPQGNAVHLIDNSRNVLANLAYDAWGQLMSGSNPTPYGYKAQWGYYTDVESGILLLTHRYLDPATGRFLTRDPIGFEGGVNLYAYVGNGVVVQDDPSGTAVRFCARPVTWLTGWTGSGGGDIDTWHWFLWTDMCGCLGYGPRGPKNSLLNLDRPGGVIPSCLGNLGDYGVGVMVCWDIGASVGQERCLCKLARNAAQGYVMCGRVWNNYNPIQQNCQDFVNCLLKKCGLPYRKYTFHGGWGDYGSNQFWIQTR